MFRSIVDTDWNVETYEGVDFYEYPANNLMMFKNYSVSFTHQNPDNYGIFVKFLKI